MGAGRALLLLNLMAAAITDAQLTESAVGLMDRRATRLGRVDAAVQHLSRPAAGTVRTNGCGSDTARSLLTEMSVAWALKPAGRSLYSGLFIARCQPHGSRYKELWSSL